MNREGVARCGHPLVFAVYDDESSGAADLSPRCVPERGADHGMSMADIACLRIGIQYVCAALPAAAFHASTGGLPSQGLDHPVGTPPSVRVPG